MGRSALSEEALLANHWTLTGASLLLVCVRLYIRVYLRHNEWHWADYFAIAGWLCSCAWTAGQTATYQIEKYQTPPPSLQGDEVIVWLVKYNKGHLIAAKINCYAYLMGVWLMKFSMFCMYSEFIEKGRKKLEVALNCIWFVTVLCFLVFLVEVVFWCPSPSDEYRFHILSQQDGYRVVPECSPGIENMTFYKALAGTHLGIDFVIWVFPAFILPSLQLSKRQKVGVVFLFLAGLMFMLAAASAVPLLESKDIDNSWSEFCLSWAQFWAVIVSNGIACKRFTRWIVIPSVQKAWRKLFGREVLAACENQECEAEDDHEEQGDRVQGTNGDRRGSGITSGSGQYTEEKRSMEDHGAVEESPRTSTRDETV